LLTGGNIWTGDAARPRASALLVVGTTLAAVGQDREIERLAPDGARHVALDGRVVVPGFADAHVHILEGGLALTQLDLSAARSRAEIHSALTAYAAAHHELPWILGRGWSYQVFAPALPTAAELDAAIADRPAFLRSYDGHAVWVNSRALALARIAGTTADPRGGTIVRLAGGREPSGTLLEDAISLVESKIPPLPDAAKKAAIARALALGASLGITAMGEVGGSALADLAVYEDMARAGRLPIRVSFGPPIDDVGSGIAAYAAHARALSLARRLLTPGPIKGFVDGVVESNTAQLLAPYADGSGTGAPPHLSATVLAAQVQATRAAGVDVAYHAIGDGAVRAVLDAVARVSGHSAADPRARIEHVELVDPADIPRFAELGVVASMMPIHAEPSDAGGGTWEQKVGSGRLRYAFALRSLHDAGARLAFGSDWPVAPLDPLPAIAVAITRQNQRGLPTAGWVPGQAIDINTALTAYTAGSAYAMRLERTIGVLRAGMAADLAVLDASVRLDQAATLRLGRVDLTVCAGQVVYDRAAAR
jgi:predicted amidohydrolase YtcJ